jgi:hypothetical protein
MIEQLKFSQSVKFFEQGFRDVWGLGDYLDSAKPCVFVGVYSSLDLDLITNHKGHKIVFFLGADIPNIPKLKGLKNTIFASDKQNILDIYKSLNMPYLDLIIPLKDFSEYKPTPKGDKIYCYVNNGNASNLTKHKVDLLKESIEYFGIDKFIFGVHGHSSQWVRDNWYTESFINIQLNEYAGFTSAIEMAYMGRKSISNNSAPFCIDFKATSILDILKKEIENKDLDYSAENYLCKDNTWLVI